jgi:hypothetical protein
MQRLPVLAFSALLAAAVAAPACTTYRDDLARSEHALEENRHEEALAILRMLEPDTSQLSTTDQARYAYVRGMTDFRIGYKADARHWLAVAKAMDEKTPGTLPGDWRTRLDASLAELDTQVWTGGMESLSNANAKVHAPRAIHHAPKRETPDESTTDDEEEQKPRPPPKKPKTDSDEDE